MMLDMESVESAEEAEGEETFLRTASRRTSCTAEATMIGRAIAMLRPRPRRSRSTMNVRGPAADWKNGDAVKTIDQKLEGGLKQSGALAGI